MGPFGRRINVNESQTRSSALGLDQKKTVGGSSGTNTKEATINVGSDDL
jgi:hypothetical protein